MTGIAHPRRSTVQRRLLVTSAALALQVATTFSAVAAETAPTSGPVVDVRLRYEGVSDDAYLRDANANTMRLRLGYRWLFAPGWQFYAEGESVQPLFGERYNSTANGKIQYPVIADPQSNEINQAYVGYANDSFGTTIGRQRLLFDNQRFIGNVGWRQNEQTFDALSFRQVVSDSGVTFRYAYLDRAMRVFGHQNPNPLLREYDLNGHAFNINKVLRHGTLGGYAYLIENRDVAILSMRTLGVRWTDSHLFATTTLGWPLEYARQSDWGNNPRSQDTSYRLIEPSLSWQGVTFKAGWEVLGGNGRYGFNTPYATLHAFNGWADRFLTTPVNGLDDRYVVASGKLGESAWSATWHDFRADQGDARYGSEFDASLGYPISPRLNALLKFADYRADTFSTDERKIWASLEFIY